MFLVGIAGGSGSGKTTFAGKIAAEIPEEDLVLLHQDSYYLAAPPEHLRVFSNPNFDHPLAFDWDLLKSHLVALKQKSAVDVPTYDFSENRRREEKTRLGPGRVVILEGIFSLWNEEVRRMVDLKIYLQVDADIRITRRLHRDVNERSRTMDSIISQYYETVRPMHYEFLEPTRQFADMVVGEETDVAASVVAAKIKEVLRNEFR